MKNVEIAEGGIGRRLSGTKFVLTDKPNSDQMEVWVDEDDRKLARLYATSNGTYYPEDYDAYGFSSVTVSIHGGVALPEMPKIEMPDGIEYPALIPEIEMPDGTLKPIDELFPEIAEDPLTDIGEVKMPDTVGEEGSSIVGIDPEDGYTYKAEVDENGNLDIEKVPTDIKVVKGPDNTEYTFSEEIDYSGMEVALVDKDGNIVKTKEYPTGIIPNDELSTPESETPDRNNRVKGRWTIKNLPIDIEAPISYTGHTIIEPYGSLMIYREITCGSALTYWLGDRTVSFFCYSDTQNTTFTVSYHATIVRGDGSIVNESYEYGDLKTDVAVTYQGKTAYRSGLYIFGVNEPANIYSYGGSIDMAAWAALYGTCQAEIDEPVQWNSIYSGVVYEDGTTVIASDPDAEE